MSLTLNTARRTKKMIPTLLQDNNIQLGREIQFSVNMKYLLLKRCIGIELTEVGYLTVRCTQEGDSGTKYPSDS
jgi:hypothetical protein